MSTLAVSQTAVFARRVRDHMRAPPPTVSAGTPCHELVRLLADHGASSAVMVDQEKRPLAIVTERDVTRRIAFHLTPTSAAREAASSPVLTIDEDEYLFRAIGEMRRRGVRHVPVVDASGRLTGLLHLHEALAAAMARPLDLIERLTGAATRAGLAGIKGAQVELAEGLLADVVPAPEVVALVTHINNDLYRRVVAGTVERLREAGWGQPPADFEVIVMGSGGRGESLLFPDQDNGFVIADHPDEARSTIDAYFIELAERMTRELDALGFALCRGHVMATNPLWRKTVSEWCAQVRLWLRRATPTAIRCADILLDFAPVYGSGTLAARLRDELTALTPKHHLFLQAMQKFQAGHGVALGLFGRLTADDASETHRGELNLKYHALLPLVESVRLLAARHGVPDTSTRARIAALAERGVLDADEHDYLEGAFAQTMDLLLREQLADFRAGRSTGVHIPLEALSERDRDLLVKHLRAVEALRERIRYELGSELV